METANYTAHRFTQRAIEKTFAEIGEYAPEFNGNRRYYNIGSVAAVVTERISGRVKRTLVVHRRLYNKFIANLVIVCPFSADFNKLAAKLMTDNYRVFGYVIGNTLVVGALYGGFIRRHTKTVRYDLGKDFVVFNFGELEGFKTKIVFAVKLKCSCFHFYPPKQ